MKHFFKNTYFYLFAFVLLFAAGNLLYRPLNNDTASTIKRFEEALHAKEKHLKEELSVLLNKAQTHNYEQLYSEMPEYYHSLMEEEGLALLIYENDTLKFWSDNSIAVENKINEVCLDTKMAKLKNGWFEVIKANNNSSSAKIVIGLILIKNEYPYQNKYLNNDFHRSFNIPSGSKLIAECTENTKAIHNSENDFLFCVEINYLSNIAFQWTVFIAFLCVFVSFIFLILFLKKFIFSFFPQQEKLYGLLLFSFIVVALRFLSIHFSFPAVFYRFDLFNPKIFADASSVWLSSLGDLAINAVLLFYLSYLAFQSLNVKTLVIPNKKSHKIILLFFLLLVFYWFSSIITGLFTGLIKNSNIPFAINNIFSLNFYSYISIFIVGILLFVLFLLCEKTLSIIREYNIGRAQTIILILCATLGHVIISHLTGMVDLIIVLWPFVIMIVIAALSRINFSSTIFLVFSFTVFAVFVFDKHTYKKEKEIRKIYAERLAAEQDPVAELLFQEVKTGIKNDSTLLSNIRGIEKNAAQFEKHLRQQYFSGFWEKYDVHIALFDSMCMPIVVPQNTSYDNNLYFDEKINTKGSPTSCEDYSYISNNSGKINYVGKIILKEKNKNLGTLYIDMENKFISDEIGFPELLLDKNITLSQELSNYSYAKYKNKQLIAHHGKYTYSLNGAEFPDDTSAFSFINHQHFNHLIFKPNNESIIIISKPDEGFVGLITTFSYLFTFFSLLLLLILIIKQLSKGRLFDNFSFKSRIQILLVLIVLLSLSLFGGGTIIYMKKQFENKNRENISEKIQSIETEIQEKLSGENNLNENISAYATYILKKFSNVFFTDINLYDLNGNLFASSRPKVFDEGLASKKINPQAYTQIAIVGKTSFIHDEQIGKLKYLSAYLPFKNKNGKLIAYVNLPYFAKQNELEKEISGFLVALINIYVLLFVFSIMLAILISNYVTQPLKLIQDKLSKIKLGKTNELIEWKEKDEIGSLVNEYNRMIIELSKSAELLAKSERESAWREMAKQVAHEIKNPLTPMKLSIQHLQRTWNDKAPDMDKKIENITQTIIEQIDALSSIATEFSNFAKMPKANLENVDLISIIENSIQLFNQHEEITIAFEKNNLRTANVQADKEQLLRVFNNLFKNALQSIPENRKGEISISLKKSENHFLVAVADNGTGIADNVKDKIFTPNFTTKNAGMGLGLAIVKSIVESYGGSIWFETTEGKGTTFYIETPAL